MTGTLAGAGYVLERFHYQGVPGLIAPRPLAIIAADRSALTRAQAAYAAAGAEGQSAFR
jgi:hypothetical protein